MIEDSAGSKCGNSFESWTAKTLDEALSLLR